MYLLCALVIRVVIVKSSGYVNQSKTVSDTFKDLLTKEKRYSGEVVNQSESG